MLTLTGYVWQDGVTEGLISDRYIASDAPVCTFFQGLALVLNRKRRVADCAAWQTRLAFPVPSNVRDREISRSEK
jgi:hypothetical protein